MLQFENLKYEIQEKGVTITGVSNNDFSALKIPALINSKPVRKIGFRAFAGRNKDESCSLMRAIELPFGLTEIQDGAFSNCTGLEKISIPPSVTKIGESAFYSCQNLKEIEIPNSVTSIHETAFEQCKKLDGITLAFYDFSAKKSRLFADLFSCDSMTCRPDLLKKKFVFIPKDDLGLYSSYVQLCGSNFSWQKYDALFNSNISAFSKIKIALFRLLEPENLDRDTRYMYESFIKINSSQFIEHFIKTDNLEMLTKFGTLGLINKDNIENCIITARITGSNNALLYLVSYRYKKINRN